MLESIMKEILLSQEELNVMRHAYEKEYIELSRRVEHLKSVLGKLGSDLPLTTEPVSIAAPAPVKVAKATKKRGRKKKRGPKSVWGDFIVNRLKSVDRPMSYEEMLKDALVLKNVGLLSSLDDLSSSSAGVSVLPIMCGNISVE